MNPVAESLTGWTQAEGRPLTEVFHIVNEDTRVEVENPALRAIKEGVILGLANHTLLLTKDGREISVLANSTSGGDFIGGMSMFLLRAR